MRRPQAPVAQLELDGQADRVLHAVAAPRRADAGLHRAQRLAVGVARLEAGVDQPLPDGGQLLDAGAEQVDALAAGDLRVEVEVAGDLADGDELVGRDLAAGHAGHHRVGAVALEVGEEVVVGVLQRGLLAVEDVAVAQRREHRGHRRLADLAAPAACRASASSSANDRDAARPARGRTAPGGCRRSARTGGRRPRCRPCGSSSSSSSLSSGTQPPQPVPALVQALMRGDVVERRRAIARADRALGDVVARADVGAVGQRRRRRRDGGAAVGAGAGSSASARSGVGSVAPGHLHAASGSAAASPTSTPPSTRVPSASTTSLLVDAGRPDRRRRSTCASRRAP